MIAVAVRTGFRRRMAAAIHPGNLCPAVVLCGFTLSVAWGLLLDMGHPAHGHHCTEGMVD